MWKSALVENIVGLFYSSKEGKVYDRFMVKDSGQCLTKIRYCDPRFYAVSYLRLECTQA